MLTYEENVRAYFSGLAKKHNLDYVSLLEIPLDSFSLEKKNQTQYLRLQAIPIPSSSKGLTVATSNPTEKNIRNIKQFWNVDDSEINVVVTSRQDIVHVLSNFFKSNFIYESAHTRDEIDYTHSASYTFSISEKIFLIAILFFMGWAALFDFFTTGMWIEVFLAMGTTIIISYKLGLSLHAIFAQKRKQKVIYTLDQEDLPVYTILLPMLREKEETVSALLKSLDRLDYPKELLDIKFLLEEDDVMTHEVMKKFSLPWYQQIIVVPPGKPRSKPHACNYGLELSFGEYLTIYDAEDCPDADQLKRALQKFHDLPKQVGCIQAALNFYNSKVNIITRLFTVEYTHWFDFMIPSLSDLRVPVPLGGTSNHFKIEALHKMGGWDPYVGTEDAEIGVRMYRHGYRVGTTSSTTYEEANEKFWNWFFQRARWAKGYMQTYLINMRDPIQMMKDMGPRSFLGFQCFVGGNVFVQLANLPLWIYMILSLFIPNSFFADYHLEMISAITWYNFIVSNSILLLCEFIAVYKRKLYYLLPYVPFRLIYWIFMSFAGYYAIFELLVRPSFWYKTEHGFEHKSK